MEVKKRTFNAWITYQAINAHFTREYDYFKYNGKLNMTESSMENQFYKNESGGKYSAQRTIFSNLGKQFKYKEDLVFFYLSQFSNMGFIEDITYPSSFDSEVYEEYKERMNNFHFYLKRDIEEVLRYMQEYDKTFDELFVAEKINHPPILKLGLSRRISLETFTTLDIILNFLPQMEQKLIDPASKDFIKLVRSYKPFLSMTGEKEMKIIKDTLMKG